MLKYVLQIQIKVLSRQGTINCNFLGTMWQRHVSYSGYSHNLKIRNLLVFTPSTRTCLESWGRQLQNDIMCDALGFKGSVVGSGKVDNWSFRWNDVTPTGINCSGFLIHADTWNILLAFSENHQISLKRLRLRCAPPRRRRAAAAPPPRGVGQGMSMQDQICAWRLLIAHDTS